MTRAPLSHFAQHVAERDSMTLAEAVRLLASDAGIRGAHDLPIHSLSRIIMVEHDDGSLEVA